MIIFHYNNYTVKYKVKALAVYEVIEGILKHKTAKIVISENPPCH